MEFDSNRSIYLQICDAICERILSGELEAEARIPSVREYGADNCSESIPTMCLQNDSGTASDFRNYSGTVVELMHTRQPL